MIGRAHHLQDDRLFECYLSGLDGAAVDRLVASHLAECPHARAPEGVEFMDGFARKPTPRRMRFSRRSAFESSSSRSCIASSTWVTPGVCSVSRHA